MKKSVGEVQKHGFFWERELLHKVYGAEQGTLNSISYTNKFDLPAAQNKLDGVNLSIKTSHSLNAVCMADCLRVFDAVHSKEPIHMTVIHYTQDELNGMKHITKIVQIDLTDSGRELFGSLTRAQIEELANMVKAVPQKRRPTREQHEAIYTLKNALQPLSGAIHLDVKCNSQQSRLQCSFNRFQTFLKENSSRVIATSDADCVFRGFHIQREFQSGRRTFNKHRECD